jgi:hypothetical protein
MSIEFATPDTVRLQDGIGGRLEHRGITAHIVEGDCFLTDATGSVSIDATGEIPCGKVASVTEDF